MTRGRLVQARYVPRSPSVPPCIHTAHVSRPPRRLRVLWRHGIRGLALLAQATVLAAVVYVALLSVLLVGAGR